MAILSPPHSYINCTTIHFDLPQSKHRQWTSAHGRFWCTHQNVHAQCQYIQHSFWLGTITQCSSFHTRAGKSWTLNPTKKGFYHTELTHLTSTFAIARSMNTCILLPFSSKWIFLLFSFCYIFCLKTNFLPIFFLKYL